jgi:tetratricopeptide (TPR) repeat protein
MREKISVTLLLFFTAFLACAASGQSKLSGQAHFSSHAGVSQKPLEGFQKDLLLTAFDVASAIKVNPHIVERSVAQEEVVGAVLDLGQPELALPLIDRIENWRKGTAQADLGLFYAHSGQIEEAKEHFKAAEKIAATIHDWQRDRIRAHVARGYAYIGEQDKAKELSQNIDRTEAAKVGPALAKIVTDEDFDVHYEVLKGLLSQKQQFDIKRNMLLSVVELWNTNYDNPKRRKKLEKLIQNSWGDLLGVIRIELITLMSEYALEHQDPKTALKMLTKSDKVFDIKTWHPQYGIPVAAQLAQLYYHAGKPEKAQALINQAEAAFGEKQHEIAGIYQSQTLVPIADAYQIIGRTQDAFRVYTQALDVADDNPNARPRAEDIARICRSMAVASFEPTPELWQRLRELKDGLGDPW